MKRINKKNLGFEQLPDLDSDGLPRRIYPGDPGGPAKIWVPHNKGEICFLWRPLWDGSYQNLGKLFLKEGMGLPTGDKMASLVYRAKKFWMEESADNVLSDRVWHLFNTMRNGVYYIYNRNLWTDRGVYVVLDPRAVGSSRQLDVRDLEKKLKGGKELPCGVRFSRDKKVRFAPEGSYRLKIVPRFEHIDRAVGGPFSIPCKVRNLPDTARGEFSASSDFARDGFVIASFGEKGAENMEYVAQNSGCTCLRTAGKNIKKGEQPVQTVSAFGLFSLSGLFDSSINYCRRKPPYFTTDCFSIGILKGRKSQ